MSWIRQEADDPRDGWLATLGLLQEQGVELPTGLAITDLRWWQDQIMAPGSRLTVDDLPSLSELAERWGWVSAAGKPSVKRVRLLLADEARWSDPMRLDAWRALRAKQGHGQGTVRARQGHDEGTVDIEATPVVVTEGHDEGTTRARQGHDEGNTRVGDPPSPSPSQDSREGVSVSRPTPTLLQVEPDADPSPAWARKARRPKGVTPSMLAEAVSRCVTAIRGSEGMAAASNAEPVISLWCRLGSPPLAAFVADVEVVASAARECPEPMFARDIRAEGWDGGTNRARTVASVCRFGPPAKSQGATWDERVEAARRWKEGRRGEPSLPTAAGSPPARAAPASLPRDTRSPEEIARIRARREDRR